MKKAFHKNNAPVVYLFVLHMWIFRICWLRNVQRFITRAKPLHDSLLNLFFCDLFAAVVVCASSLLSWSIKSHDVDLSVFCLLLYFWFKPRSHWKIPNEQLSSSTLENDCTICPWKFAAIRPGIFGRMVSAHGLGRAYRKAMFFARSSLPKWNLDWRRSRLSIGLNVH